MIPASVVPTIKSGPRAGQPLPRVEYLIDRVTNVRSVLIKVKRSGYQVIDVDLKGLRPTITLEYHADLARLVEEGVACYYIQRTIVGVSERVGQFVIDGVRIIWIERD